VDDSISGDLKLVGWSAGQVEEGILRCTLDKFEAAYPNVTVEFQQIADDYQGVMTNRLGSGDAPDLFYVNSSYAQDWIDQGLLQPLDDMAGAASFDTSQFYPNLLSTFQQDGKSYAYPKDSSVLGMQTNDDLLTAAGITAPPTTLDELVTAAQALKDNGVDTPMCFAAEWPRAGAMIEAEGGGIVDEQGNSLLETDGTKTGIQWYLDQYTNGLAKIPADLGDGWCGEAFGRGHVAIAFEGNWIGPFLADTYPDINYTISPIPTGTQQATLAFTAGYGISPNSANQDESWALLTYLTGQEGMQSWVDGGLVLPARDDVTVNDPTLQQYAAFTSFAHPGEGLTPQWSRVADAFNGALSGEITGGHDAQAVIDATKAVLDQVQSGQ
jgi:multiple sugar transport system substrate-binding protein